MAVNGSNIYVVWSEATQQTLDIYLKRSFDGGATWTANRRLTNTVDQSWGPRIAVNGSNIYLAWYDRIPGNYEIFFKRSIDGGATWTANRRLSSTAGMSYVPGIAVDGSNVYVVWYDDTPGNFELYFKKGIFD
jgi:Neuraminidase (sialidase)